jgi:hypothetical protein
MGKKHGGVQFAEQSSLHGRLCYTVFKNGAAIEKCEENNLIMDGARLQMAHLVAGDAAGRNIGRIAVGTSGNMPTVTDTEITAPFIKAVDGFDYPANGQVRIRWKLLVSEANGMEIREFGLLTADGTLFARRIREKPIFKESDISIEGEWIIAF